MKRNIQKAISLVLMFLGSLLCAYHAGQFSAWSECDNRYKAHVDDLDTNDFGIELRQYFETNGQQETYLKNFETFKPSGKMYSGSNESGVFIVGGSASALLGLAGYLDTFRRRK
jgi:hypothetical protein